MKEKLNGIMKKSYYNLNANDLNTLDSFVKVYLSDLCELNGLSIAIYSYVQLRFNSILGYSSFTLQELSTYLRISLKNSREYIIDCLEQLCELDYLSYVNFDGDRLTASYYNWNEQIKGNFVYHKDTVLEQNNNSAGKFVKMCQSDLEEFSFSLYNLQKRESVLKTYLAIVSHIYDPDGYCYPSVDRISKISGLCERTVRSCISAIKKYGYLKIWSCKYLNKQNKIRQSPNFYSFVEMTSVSDRYIFSGAIKDFRGWIIDKEISGKPETVVEIYKLNAAAQIPIEKFRHSA